MVLPLSEKILAMCAIGLLFTMLIGALVRSAIITTLFVTTLTAVPPIFIGMLCAGSALFITPLSVIKLILFAL